MESRTEPRMTVLDALTSPTITPDILRIRIEYWLKVADRNERNGRVEQAKRVRRNCKAMKQQGRAIAVEAVSVITPQVAPVEVPAGKVKRVATPKIAPVDFWDLRDDAIDAIVEVYGTTWKCMAPIGETTLMTVPVRLRSYKTERGGQVRYRADHRFPAAKYWCHGVIPGDCIETPDYARDTRACEWGPGTKYPEYLAWQSAWCRANNLTRSGDTGIFTAKLAA